MFNKILVPVDIDYPKTSKAVYDNAAELASLSGAQIRIVSVMPGFTMPIVAAFVTEEIKKEARNHFQKALDEFVAANCKGVTVVYHNRSRTVNEAFSNTCAQRVVKDANCSVLRLRNLLK